MACGEGEPRGEERKGAGREREGGREGAATGRSSASGARLRCRLPTAGPPPTVATAPSGVTRSCLHLPSARDGVSALGTQSSPRAPRWPAALGTDLDRRTQALSSSTLSKAGEAGSAESRCSCGSVAAVPRLVVIKCAVCFLPVQRASGRVSGAGLRPGAQAARVPSLRMCS